MANVNFIPNVKTAVGFDNLNTISTYTNQVAASTTTIGDTYNVIVPAPDEVLVGQYILVFTPDSISISSMKVSVNGGTALPLYAGDTPIAVGSIKSGVSISVLVDVVGSKVYSLDARVEDLEDIVSNKSAKSTIQNKTLSSASWTGSVVPYSYSLTVTGVTTTSVQEVLPTTDITSTQLTALLGATIQDGGQSADTMVLKAWGTKPTIDLPIRVILRGDI